MSDWKKDAAQRRDYRGTKVPDEPDSSIKAIKRKNTKKYCKGKAGREHKTVCMTYAEAKQLSNQEVGKFFRRTRLLVCTVCGKEVDIYYGIRQENKPEWVDK